ncbi:MAG TPA: response regulator [Nitrososphaera sp.]|nr:response regulator [Nitrososphaera sp.]
MATRQKVMVVDDEYDIVHIIRKHLEKWGFSVDTYTNPLYALQMFKDNPDRYSVLMTDIAMPEMRGSRLANLMLEVKADLKVIIMTAYEIDPEDIAVNLPIISHDDILKKPFSMVQVCDTVKRKLQAAH